MNHNQVKQKLSSKSTQLMEIIVNDETLETAYTLFKIRNNNTSLHSYFYYLFITFIYVLLLLYFIALVEYYNFVQHAHYIQFLTLNNIPRQ